MTYQTKHKIFITGCAKTGTTLVRRLFNAFNLSVYNHDEMDIDGFLASDYEVAKRSVGTLFSNSLDPKEEKRQADILATITVINVTRDKESVLASDNRYVSENRYKASLDQANRYSNIIDYTITYERLMEEPDVVQKEIADQLGLEILYPWSDYPNFIDIAEESKHTHKGIYKPRPIGAPKCDLK